MSVTNTIPKELEKQKEQALSLMKDAGFPVTTEVGVLLDKELPFMGYTTEQNGKPVIVVSEQASTGGMAINLLVHELSHVYRIQSGHPSHNYSLITNIMNFVAQGRIVYSYQEEIVGTIINHLQDIYADDISFKIFAKTAQHQDLNEFFLTWIHEPSTAKDSVQRSWENAAGFVSAAFAISNLERHKVHDQNGIVADAVSQYLGKAGKGKENSFYFFKEFMTRMPEEVTDKEYEKLLIHYLNEFFKLTNVL